MALISISNTVAPTPLVTNEIVVELPAKSSEKESEQPSATEGCPGPKDKVTDKVVQEADNEGRYDGDKIDFEGPITKSGVWEAIAFESPFELVYTIDRHLNTGVVTLHKWQIETLEELATCKPTSQKPHRFALCAANGSGKDQYVIAPFVLWFALTKIRSLTVITSSSGVQLTAQTENYIASMAHAVNTLFGERVFKITKRFIKCLKSGSEIRMFATDEAGKAEGYHPLEPNAEMAIIVNEAKSVAPDIFGALSRCTGYNYWLNVSTPGEPVGDFWDSFESWLHKRRVTAFDCPHLSPDHILEVKRKYGERSAIYRSQILALFTSIGGQVVISSDSLDKLIEMSVKKLIKPIDGKKNKVGIDLAAGRDECSFTCVNGNRILDYKHFVEKDTTITEDECERFIRKHGARSKILDGSIGNCDIFADDGGLGHAIIDRLVRKGYSITRVLNQHRAYDSTQFGNHGAEMWFNVARIVEECLFYLPMTEQKVKDTDDNILYNQLCYRHYKKQETQGKITLASKKEEKEEGLKSPDRADSLVLALSDTSIDIISKAKRESDTQETKGFTFAELFAMRNSRHREMIEGLNRKSSPVKGNSLETLMKDKGLVNN